jgi:hypothetical protein
VVSLGSNLGRMMIGVCGGVGLGEWGDGEMENDVDLMYRRLSENAN